MNIESHPTASRLPQTESTKPTSFGAPTSYRESFIHERSDQATVLKDWTLTDRPALSVHVVCFRDAMLLHLYYPHVLMDILGHQSLVKAWIAVLEGREEDVPEFIEQDPYPLVSIGYEPRDYLFHNAVMNGLQSFFFFAKHLFEQIFYPEVEERTMCLPGPWIENIRNKAISDLASQQGELKKDPALLPSRSDIFLAWLAKATSAALNLRADHPITIINVFTIRGMHESALPSSSAFIGNAVLPAYTPVTAGELHNLSLGELALRLRTSLIEQRTPQQVGSYISLNKQAVQQSGRLPLIGPWNKTTIWLTNWQRAEPFDVDFAAAVQRAGKPLSDRKAQNKIGQPSLLLPLAHFQGARPRNMGPMVGRDAAGNWWLCWTMRKGAWGKFEELLQSVLGHGHVDGRKKEQ